jgi:hypothetical protein
VELGLFKGLQPKKIKNLLPSPLASGVVPETFKALISLSFPGQSQVAKPTYGLVRRLGKQ